MTMPGGSATLSGPQRRDRVVMLSCLAICGVFPVVMLVVRRTATSELSYLFLFWNLFLAGIPVLTGLAFETSMRHRRRASSAAWFAVWLLFLPNGPYLMTDLVHLRQTDGVPLWFDALTLVSAAVAGLLAGFVSLRFVHGACAAAWGELRGWAVALAALALCGFGVYLGRFARLNSWDVLTRPHKLLYSSTAASPLDNPEALLVSALFSSFLVVSYAVVMAMTTVGADRADRRTA